jgi:uncharacterized small protein (DUF1192 family)
MAFLEDDRPKKLPTAQPGESLADLSVDELKKRIGIYRDEIERLEGEIAAKEKHLKAAEAFFRR